MIRVSKQFSPVTLILSTQDDVADLTRLIKRDMFRMTSSFLGLREREVPQKDNEYYHKMKRLLEQLERTHGT